MNTNTTILGYIAIGCFLAFTGLGLCAQVLKLYRRTRAWKAGKLARSQVCEGLQPVREIWSHSAFLLFALSGLTRDKLDYFLLLSRVPVIGLSSVILWYLHFHQVKNATKFYRLALVGNLALISLIIISALGYQISHSIIPQIIDLALALVSLLLFYGKQSQAFHMYRQKRSQAVSWLREFGLIIKDLSGLCYSLSVGNALYWVSLTHILSAISSSAICLVKFVLERPKSL